MICDLIKKKSDYTLIFILINILSLHESTWMFTYNLSYTFNEFTALAVMLHFRKLTSTQGFIQPTSQQPVFVSAHNSPTAQLLLKLPDTLKDSTLHKPPHTQTQTVVSLCLTEPSKPVWPTNIHLSQKCFSALGRQRFDSYGKINQEFLDHIGFNGWK